MSLAGAFGRTGPLLGRTLWNSLWNGSQTNGAVSLNITRNISKRRVRVLREMYHRSRSFDLEPHKQRHRSEWADWNYPAELFAFNQRLNGKFNEITLKTAFTHLSYVNAEQKKREQLQLPSEHFNIEHNQKLIDQGRTHLKQFLPSYLRYFLRQLPEEGISAITSHLLCDETLSQVSNSIGCNDLILAEDFPLKKETRANTVVALIGANLRDNGSSHANKFVIDFIATHLQSMDLMDIWNIVDPFSALNCIVKNSGMSSPEPRLLRETGRNTLIPCFLVGYYSDKQLLGSGPGDTLQKATEMAAYDCLRRTFALTSAKTLFKYGPEAYELDYAKYDQPSRFIQDWVINHKSLSSSPPFFYDLKEARS